MPKTRFPDLPPYGVLVESHSHGPDFHLGVHSHPFPSLLYIVSGRGEYRVNNKRYAIDPNSVILLDANYQHELTDSPGSPMTVFVAYFSSDLAADNAPRFDALVEHDGPITLLPQQAEQTRTLMRRMLNEQSRKSTEYEFSIKLSLERILLELYRAFCAQEEAASFRSPDSSKRVAAVLDYIAEHPYEQHTLSDAARIASLSQRQFRNICNELKGCGFSEYLNRLRIEHAEELLRDTNMSVTAIAFQVGYEDLSTFYRAFKKTHEIPPGRFREEMENN